VGHWMVNVGELDSGCRILDAAADVTALFPLFLHFAFGLISKQLRLYWQLCCKFIGMLCKLG